MNNIQNTYQTKTLSLSKRWNIASSIWHNKEVEGKIIRTLFNKLGLYNESDNIIDVACGTGFHSIIVKEMGFDVTSSDIDTRNLNLFKEQLSKENYSILLKVADWRHIHHIISSKYNAVLCLGSSITYFESWNNDSYLDTMNRILKLKEILSNFKLLLKNGGHLIIGYSRFYYGDSSRINFPSKIVAGVLFDMKWNFFYNWDKKTKKWLCEIYNEYGEDYSFELQSHLYSLEEFANICKEIYSEVEVVDINKNYYDKFIICR